MQLNTNGKSKILVFMCENTPPFSKMALAIELKLSERTIEQYCTSLKAKGFIKTDGNGYWSPTEEGRKQYEIDPLLPAEAKAKDSSRVFSLSQSWNFIEKDYYCRWFIEFIKLKYVDPNWLLPFVVLWLKETEQLSSKVFSEISIDQYNPELGTALIDFLNQLENIAQNNKEIKEKA